MADTASEGKRVEQPALFVAGESDPVILWSRGTLERMPAAMPTLTQSLLLPGTGHWVQQERPAEVNHALLQFLAGL